MQRCIYDLIVVINYLIVKEKGLILSVLSLRENSKNSKWVEFIIKIKKCSMYSRCTLIGIYNFSVIRYKSVSQF